MTNRSRLPLGLIVLLALASAGAAWAQSSSLYLTGGQAPAAGRSNDGRLNPPLIQATSYAAVLPPEPRGFAVHDLVTIIVRESSSAAAEASLETKKDVSLSGKISAFPNLRPDELIRARLAGGALSNPPEVGVEYANDYSGEGDYERADQITTRITARVVDVKPNGMLALEARTHIKNDEETVTIKLTGYCRSDDVAIDNTVLSTQMFDLRIEKVHEGELRRASQKGLISKVLDLIFNF